VGAGRRSRHSAPIPRKPPRIRGSVCRSAFQPYRDFATSPPRDRLGSLAGPREPSAFAGDARSLGRVTDRGSTRANQRYLKFPSQPIWASWSAG
jgi:hypothetical protein